MNPGPSVLLLSPKFVVGLAELLEEEEAEERGGGPVVVAELLRCRGYLY